MSLCVPLALFTCSIESLGCGILLFISFLFTSSSIFLIWGDNSKLVIAFAPSIVDSVVCTIVSSIEWPKNNKIGFKIFIILFGKSFKVCNMFINKIDNNNIINYI